MHIKTQNLSKKYGSKTVVDGVNLDLVPGQILALLGPNGAGKSTTIKMLTGRAKPTSGKILIDDTEYTSFPEKLLSSLGIMPQEIVVWDDLTIRENLDYTASLYKLPKNQADAKIQEIISDLKLTPEINTLAKNLSGGYKRRVNLAISVLHSPKVIFLDEPTPGIDAQSRILLTEYIQKLADKKEQAIVLTDHYLDQAEKLADYVVIIDGGKIITEGTVSELKAKHSQGNILQIHLNSQDSQSLNKAKEIFAKHFQNPTLHKQTISILIQDISQNLSKAIDIVKQENMPIFNINVKEPTLEDIFLLLTGKEVRE